MRTLLLKARRQDREQRIDRPARACLARRRPSRQCARRLLVPIEAQTDLQAAP